MKLPNSLHLHLEQYHIKLMNNLTENDSRILKKLNLNIYETTTQKERKRNESQRVERA